MIDIDILIYYLLTCLIEVIVLLILFERRMIVLLSSLVINALTNIPLNLFLKYYIFDSMLQYYLVVIGLEILIVFIEAFLYYLIIKDKKKSLLYGFFCNAFSFSVGLLLTSLLSLTNITI